MSKTFDPHGEGRQDSTFSRKMAFTAKIIVSSQKVESEEFAYDHTTDSYFRRLSAETREKWSQGELEEAKALSRSSQGLIALVYIECFGGVCDHWAAIYDCGNRVDDFNEVDDLALIMRRAGIVIPESGYFSPLDRDKASN